MDLLLISASNRPGNRTKEVTGFYQQILQDNGHKVKLLDLQEIESQWLVEGATGKKYLKCNPLSTTF